MKTGDLVRVHDYCDAIYESDHSEWFVQAKENRIPMIFLKWSPEQTGINSGWAQLLHPDGSKKIVHCDYFIKI